MTPILFIPGLFGCMSSQIVAGTGTWQFGFAKHMYDPFIKLMTDHGFTPNENLFILFYDWQQSTAFNVSHYLIPFIKKMRISTGASSFYLIAHGVGGYLAKYLVQNYPSFSPKLLIYVGTPHAGFASAFSYLTGGVLPTFDYQSLDFIHLYFRMHLYKNLTDSTSSYQQLIHQFPALPEMIPSHFYGDYLFYDYNHSQYFTPYQSMTIQNTFLDQICVPTRPHAEDLSIHLIGGEGTPTIEHFEIMPACTISGEWLDGKFLDCTLTNEGDGIHLLRSVFASEGIVHTVQSDYESLLVQAAPIYLPLIL